MPAAFHSRSSAECVPLLSPRETNGAFAAAIFFSAATMSLPPATLAGSAFGPISTKSLYITSRAFDAVALGDELLLSGLGVDEHDVGVAAPPRSSAWPVPSATTRTWMPVFFSNAGSRCLNRPRLLGRGGRGDGDEFLLRLRRERQAQRRSKKQSQIKPTAVLL